MIKINLLGDSARTKMQAWHQIQLVLASIAVLISVAVLGRFWFSKHVRALQKSEESTSRELVYIRTLAHRVRTLENQQAEATAELAALNALFQAKESTVRILDSLVSALPERAWLVELRETEQGLKVSGLAQDGETISIFARELEKSPVLAGVAIDVARQSVRHGVKLQEFSIGAQRAHAKPLLVKTQPDSPKDKARK
jgi:Tfp pilus assembly protein PilN